MRSSLLLIVLAIFIATSGCAIVPVDQSSTGTEKTVPLNVEPENNNNDICVDRCGNGVCEEIVCLATGCPCVESASSCPSDCSN